MSWPRHFLRILLFVLLLNSANALLRESGSAKADLSDGEALLHAGRANEAITALQNRLSADKQDARAYHLLSRVYYSLGLWDQAIKAGERSIALAPDNSNYHLWLGRAYGLKAENANPFSAFGLARKARAQFETAVQLNGDNTDARSDLTEFYTEAPGFLGGGKDKARVQIEAIARTNPANAHYLSARLAEKDKNFAEAEAQYKAAIQQSSTPAEHWVNLASYYREQNNLQAMEEAVEKAATTPRKHGNVLVDAASMLLQSNRNLPRAVELFRQYLHASDKVEDAPAFRVEYMLGQILEKQGDKSGAARQYQASLALASDFPDARDALRRLSK